MQARNSNGWPIQANWPSFVFFIETGWEIRNRRPGSIFLSKPGEKSKLGQLVGISSLHSPPKPLLISILQNWSMVCLYDRGLFLASLGEKSSEDDEKSCSGFVSHNNWPRVVIIGEFFPKNFQRCDGILSRTWCSVYLPGFPHFFSKYAKCDI